MLNTYAPDFYLVHLTKEQAELLTNCHLASLRVQAAFCKMDKNCCLTLSAEQVSQIEQITNSRVITQAI